MLVFNIKDLNENLIGEKKSNVKSDFRFNSLFEFFLKWHKKIDYER